MRKTPYLKIVFASILIVLIGSLLVFGVRNKITGFAIEEEEAVTREIALIAINNSEIILQDMKDRGFEGIFVEDALLDAKRIFQQVEYAEILRNKSILGSDPLKKEANAALGLLNWELLSYEEVLVYTKEVKKRRDQILRLNDLIELRGKDLEQEGLFTGGIFAELEKINNTEVVDLLEEARRAFNDGRYEDTERFLDEAKLAAESARLELASLSGLQKGAFDFFKRFWIYLVLFFIIFGVVGFFTYGRVRLILLKKKVEKMRAEKKSLIELMKTAQTERFKLNKISESVYEIRMKKYKERLSTIKQDLPVFKSRLTGKKDLNKNKQILNKKKGE